MDDLVAFMRRCVDDDERAIERMRNAPMHGVESGAEEDYLMFADRAPAEVKAKRAILDLYDSVLHRQQANSEKFVRMTRLAVLDQQEFTNVKTHSWELAGMLNGLRIVIGALAQPFAGRDGWREEWAL